MTVSVALALCESVALTPWNATANVPAAAGAEKVTCCGVAEDSTNDEAGKAFIPRGNPLTVTVTAPVKPFCGAKEMVMGAVVPPTRVETEDGEMARAKSPVGGGRAGGADEPPPPPQPARIREPTVVQ